MPLAALLAAAMLGVMAAASPIAARVFSVERARADHLRTRGGLDRALGGLLALLGLTIAMT